MGERAKSSQKCKGGQSEAGNTITRLLLLIRLWDLSVEPGFVEDSSQTIMSVMGSGRTKHQRRELDWTRAGNNTVVGAMFFCFP